MPRPKKEAGGEPKKRSRTGCWPCKARKVKCGEEKPSCINCVKSGETCDYSIRLNWGGRSRKEGTPSDIGGFTFVSSPTSASNHGHSHSNSNGHEHIFSAQHIVPSRPPSSHPSELPTPDATPRGDAPALDPRLRLDQHLQQSLSSGVAPYLPPFNASVRHSPLLNERSPPTSAPNGDDFRWSPQHAKRVKLDPAHSPSNSQGSPLFALPPYPAPPDHSPGLSAPYSTHNIGSIVHTPATPGSSITSGSPYPQPLHGPLVVQEAPDLRRLSVKSLLSEPSEEPERPSFSRLESHGYRTYGFDHGLPDLDIPRNDDRNMVLPRSPDLRRASAAVSEISTSSGEVDARAIAFESGGYYAQPVPIKIPRWLEPLPAELVENQMNLLYFHHFVNHTGRIMVPHDCPENPFRTVLPQMAVRNQHLLHLLLAFSASHRARLLAHPEPGNRIAEWMADVVPALRQAVAEPVSPGSADPSDPTSFAPLATAIMLASLEIVSPNTFAVPIPWQQHLQVARQMIISKGGLDHLAQKADGARDKAIFFLSRWFAYLDVLGSLSGSRHEQPLFGAYLEDGGGIWLVNRDGEEIYQIDCFFGFSGRCISLLAQVAELAAQCDNARLDPLTNQVKVGWQPSAAIRHEAEELKKRLNASATTVFRGCSHTSMHSPDSSAGGATPDQDAEAIYATNEAFHWAGVIHLSRRVLALPPTDPEVQDSVQRIIEALSKVRRGSTAESCLLFPMFTAGCEAQSQVERELFMGRLKAVEGWGMENYGRARSIMQLVWDTGRPWETLVNGEFFG